MFMKKVLLGFFACALALSLVACGKNKTVTVDVYLIENPGEKKPAYVQNGKIKRGEYVKVKEEKAVSGIKYCLVQIEGVATKGWVEEKYLKEGKLTSVTVITDSDLYTRPNLKSEKAGRVSAGQVAFKIEEKDDFMLINYPGKEAYVLKNNIGAGDMVVRSVSIPGLGKATVSASSTYIAGEGRELEFDPRNVFDGSLQTAWSEGKTGEDGIGEYIQLSFTECVQLNEISIVNGWTKSEEFYKQNGRVAQMKVVSNNGTEVLLELNDDNYDYQPSQVSLAGSSFKFIITKVYKGKDSDTCLSEIKITGNACPSMPQGEGYEGGGE